MPLREWTGEVSDQLSSLSHVFTVHVFFEKKEKNVSPDTNAAGVATQSTDALQHLWSVFVLHERGATTPSSLKT